MVEDYIFIFDNFSGTSVDMGIIFPNGEIEILREVNTGYDWEFLSLKNTKYPFNWSIVGWAGQVMAGIPCAISAAVDASSGGISTSIARWTCGNYLLRLSATGSPVDFDIHLGITDFVENYDLASTGLTCGSEEILSCVSGVVSASYSNLVDDLEAIENRKEVVQSTVAALKFGYGDVQITLTWENEADLDLHVIDPDGELIYFLHDYSASNGILDVDDIDGYGPENVYWGKGDAPDGMYEIYVYHYVRDRYNYPDSSNYTVLVNAFGNIEKFTGTTFIGETVHITDFDQNGFISAGHKGTSIVINAKKHIDPKSN